MRENIGDLFVNDLPKTGNSARAEKPIAIDLFCGAGGITEGLEKAGFRVILGIDNSEGAGQTYMYNHPLTNFRLLDLMSRDNRVFPLFKRLRGKVDLVVGGPPCQGFSKANRATGNIRNPMNRLVLRFVEIIKFLQPMAFVMENVPGILNTRRGKFLEEGFSDLSKSGFCTSILLLNAVHFGVPQNRKRVFVIGMKGTTIGEPRIQETRAITARDAIMGDLPPLRGTDNSDCYEYVSAPTTPYQRQMRKHSARFVINHIASSYAEKITKRFAFIPPGGNWRDIPSQLRQGLKVSHSYMYKRLHPDLPSITIAHIGRSMLIHPVEDRGLTVREIARLQSFDDSYLFFGSLSSMQGHVGNAVPPLMAYGVGKEIYRALYR